MRRMVLAAAAAIAAGGLAACGSSGPSSSATPSSAASSAGPATASCSYSSIQKDLFAKGVLTVATDKPAYPPWFENNNPVKCIS